MLVTTHGFVRVKSLFPTESPLLEGQHDAEAEGWPCGLLSLTKTPPVAFLPASLGGLAATLELSKVHYLP